MDVWGQGSYEETALELAPVSEVAVAALGIAAGERLLDLACGSGNAALLADAAGARVTGLDASPRLLDVARARVPAGEFVQGDAAALPFGDGAFDAAVSVFGLIFAKPAETAVAELARAVRPGGRIAITTWPRRGETFEVVSLMLEALARVRPPEGPPPVDWGDPSVLDRLLAPYGELEIRELRLDHDQATPEETIARWERAHPMWMAARAVLEPAGEWETLHERSIATLRAAGGRSSSPYLLALLRRR